jgi:hypothetical protein
MKESLTTATLSFGGYMNEMPYDPENHYDDGEFPEEP